MKSVCIMLASLLIAGCTPRDAADRAVASCQRHAAGPVAEAECHSGGRK